MGNSSGSSAPAIVLKAGREGPARRRHHPWIYSQAVAEVRPGEDPAGLLPVCAADGSPLGWGFHSPDSLIAVRMVSFSPERPEVEWIARRLRTAWALRESLPIDSDARRVVNAEGDFIPGLIIDQYADTAVVTPHIRGIEGETARVTASLQELSPGLRVFVKRDEHYGRVERLGLQSGYVAGGGDGTTTIREGSVRLVVDYERGQKTGFYLDQRENRGIISRVSHGKRVLNLFAYTGAVALRAAAAGAELVTSVESSPRALQLARESAALGASGIFGVCEWVQADVFSYLEQAAKYDIVVADPPPFARRRAERGGALKGYLSLFQQCFRLLAPGGLAFLFSCSGAIDRPTFQQVIVDAAMRAGRQARMLRELHADADHPFASTHPEGEYLKGWMVHVE